VRRGRGGSPVSVVVVRAGVEGRPWEAEVRCGRGLWLRAIGRGGANWSEDCFRSTFLASGEGAGKGERGRFERLDFRLI